MSISADSILFDVWSTTYDRAGLQQAVYRPVHDAILHRIADLSPRVVLDLGCGTGQLTRRLAATFASTTVLGVDLSTGMLERAASASDDGDHDAGDAGEASGVSYAQADAQRLPLPSGSVDVVVCTESFHWYADQEAALTELHRVLAPGGRLLIASIATVTGVGDNALRQASTLAGRPIRAVPRKRMRAMLTDAGFDVTHQGRIVRLGFLPWPVLSDATRR
ncbi:MAG: class I SAM-dependent methyltransferase [Ilumatobacter sp.]|jgi:ubiquinone/menaquinone biosynthesis C-methylase UbiE|uniref:class I SAM-dependent methyltransferase n=1 Tax=Ilumatobacter sp. TaxID=1967498 RepID=UPI00391CC464